MGIPIYDEDRAPIDFPHQDMMRSTGHIEPGPPEHQLNLSESLRGVKTYETYETYAGQGTGVTTDAALHARRAQNFHPDFLL